MVQNLTYTQYGDYYIPDLRLAHTGTQTLGKYSRMRRAFLEQNKPMLFSCFLRGTQLRRCLSNNAVCKESKCQYR